MISKENRKKNRSFFSLLRYISENRYYKTINFVLLFRFGVSTIQLNKLVPLICKLVSDSNAAVNISNIIIYLFYSSFFIMNRFVNKQLIPL